MKNPESTVAVVLAGGQSSRLFPFNKIFSDLTGSGRSLLAQAYDRVTQGSSERLALVSRDDFYVLTAPALISRIQKVLPLSRTHCFAEPSRRGTWPAILWAMAHLRRRSGNALLAILTADHIISDLQTFRSAVRQAAHLAADRPVLAVIGVQPSGRLEEWCRYGAFQKSPAAVDGRAPGVRLHTFEEKPPLDRATVMMKEGRWLWNSGMFFFRIPTAEEALNVYQPAMFEIYARLCKAIAQRGRERAAKIFAEFPEQIPHPSQPGRRVDNTIDYAILMPLVRQPERGLEAWSAQHALRKWADVGDWITLGALSRKDRQGNTCLGRVRATSQVRRCILAADKGMTLSVDGALDWIIACSAGRALVIPRSRAADLKTLVAESRRPLVAVDAAALHIRLSKTRLVVRADDQKAARRG